MGESTCEPVAEDPGEVCLPRDSVGLNDCKNVRLISAETCLEATRTGGKYVSQWQEKGSQIKHREREKCMDWLKSVRSPRILLALGLRL